MNTLIHLFFLFVGLTFVVCDKKADIECVKNGAKALEGKSDEELYNLTQENLKIGETMVLKRADTANANGLTCYKKFYDNYSKGLEDILSNGEKQRVDRAKTPEEKSGAIKAIAGLTQAMRCDEDWRAIHFNETIESSECTRLERTTALAIFNFRPKLGALETLMVGGEVGLKLKQNNVMSGIVGELLGLYHTIYLEGETCSKQQSKEADKCRNLKMFAKELDRLFYLLELQVLAKM